MVDYDYAIWDFYGNFNCGDKPGLKGSFLPVAIGSVSDYGNVVAQMSAYDGNKPCGLDGNSGYDYDRSCVYPPNPGFQNRWYEDPSMIGRSIGLGGVTVVGNQLSLDMDATPGASGAGVLQNLWWYQGDPTTYFVGIYSWWASGVGHRAKRVDNLLLTALTVCATEWGGSTSCFLSM
jgi:hypothetical protein